MRSYVHVPELRFAVDSERRNTFHQVEMPGSRIHGRSKHFQTNTMTKDGERVVRVATAKDMVPQRQRQNRLVKLGALAIGGATQATNGRQRERALPALPTETVGPLASGRKTMMENPRRKNNRKDQV